METVRVIHGFLTKFFLVLTSLVFLHKCGSLTPVEPHERKIQYIYDSTLTKKELYEKISLYLAKKSESFRDSNQLLDKEAGTIVMKFQSYVKFGTRIWYTLTVDCKDKKYRLTFDLDKVSGSEPSQSGWIYRDITRYDIDDIRVVIN
ncbi:MAG: DUF4468 domain-containing protein, partial [Leptospiraceae bacterium]|nr:DUF4468 domain-containing protein [Leptospiraceae bacterium]